MNQRPALKRTPVACLSITVCGLQAEPGIDDKVQRGFVLESEVNRMVLAGREDLHKINNLALDLFKAVERASAVTADGGLAALGFSEAQRGRKAFSFAMSAGGSLRFGDGGFDWSGFG